MTIRSFEVRVTAPLIVTDEDEERMAREIGDKLLAELYRLHGETPDGYGISVYEV